MNIDTACLECLVNQSRRVAEAIGADERLSAELTGTVGSMVRELPLTQSPPEAAVPLYAKMAELARKEDLYDEVKAHSSEKAGAFLPELREAIERSDEKLLTAVKIAVAGNVIDLAAEVSFDLHEEVEKIFETAFALNDFDRLKSSLEKAESLLYIGDNVGEHLFDYLCIETLRELYPQLEIYYMVRGCAIINDVTMKEAREAGFDVLCHLVDSGVDTPGFVYERANEESRRLFDEADLVIAKGMGNYECMSPQRRPDICFLLKVKCNVVADSIGQDVGDIVCKMA